MKLLKNLRLILFKILNYYPVWARHAELLETKNAEIEEYKNYKEKKETNMNKLKTELNNKTSRILEMESYLEEKLRNV